MACDCTIARIMAYDAVLADKVCAEIASGDKSLGKALASNAAFPSRSEFYRWLNESEELRDKYARACEQRAEFLAEEIVDISDEQAAVSTPEGHTFDPDVNRDRLRIDARKWYASKVYPKKFGEKQEIAHTGAIRVSEMTDADLERIATQGATK